MRTEAQRKYMRDYMKQYCKKKPEKCRPSRYPSYKNRKRYKMTPEQRQAYSYNLSVTELLALRDKQQNRCRICQLEFTKTPHVDHDHKTGRVRGLLCVHCNSGLGYFRDSPDLLGEAIRYLRTSGL